MISLRVFVEDVISGLYEQNMPLIFSILGKSNKIEILVGTFASDDRSAQNNLEIIRTSLTGSFQGIDLQEFEADDFESRIRSFNFAGLILGTPTGKVGTEKVGVEQIERIIRGLYGNEWSYVVIALPAKDSEINSLINATMNETRLIIDSEKRTGVENPVGKRYKDLLQDYLAKLQLGKSQGMWHAVIYLFSKEREILNKSRAMAKSVFGGKDSLPDHIRTIEIGSKVSTPSLLLTPSSNPPGQFCYPYSLMNTINSQALASFVHLPSQEMPGFQIKPYARFNVAVSPIKGESISIGEVLDQRKAMDVTYDIPLKSLNKHGLIVGTTGSGKTNTLFYILKELWRHKIPFLVIEPVKTEYRKLLLSDIGNDIQVFTLGNDNISPFRINPFEIMPGVSVQSHIDLLKSVFNASFFMWGPLPHVLERCIHDVYIDKGWDLVSNQNHRGIHFNANPTLTDLYNKIDDVVSGLGYSPETTMEVRSALKTRINSLRLGSKGLMLDTKRTMSFSKLMSRPTIVELEAMGDDEEKSFMMGLILSRMYEHYISQGIFEGKDLGHITVIEEAHRLLANFAAENPYVANVKGKGVETFTNILSEIRAYGEGFLIAEQIPTKLASDVVKNTNLKVMHRTVAEDDRNVMGATMNIQKSQTESVVSLNVGEAIVFSEGDDSAYHVKIPYAKIEGERKGLEKDDNIVIKAMETFKKEAGDFAPFEGCLKHCKAICKYKAIGDTISSDQKYFSLIPSLMLLIVVNSNSKLIEPYLQQLLEAGKEEGAHTADPLGIKKCAIINAAERYLEWLGKKYYWSYKDVEELKDSFLDLYMDILENYVRFGKYDLSTSFLDQSKLDQFRSIYRRLCADRQPTVFCPSICRDGLCIYRFNLLDALEDKYYLRR